MSTSSTEHEPDDDLDAAAAVDAGQGDDGASATDDATDDGAADLGDAGKKALDAMKRENKRLREEIAEARVAGGDKRGAESIRKKAQAEMQDQLAELRAKLEGRESEYAAEKKAREVEQAALGKANDRILRSEIRAAATGKLTNPAMALKLLDLSSFEVGDDGEVDQSAISAALDQLLASDPYLGVTQGDTKRFQGTGDGGAKGNAGKPQLTEAQVKQMSKEGKYAEIEQARVDGRLNNLLGIT